MEYKITMGELFRIENEYGVNLSTGDAKEEWIYANNKMQLFSKEKYEPFLSIYSKKIKPSQAQEEMKHKLDMEFERLYGIVNYERIKYYTELLEYFTGNSLDNEDLTREDIEEFASDYEHKMKQYFIIQNSKEDDTGKQKELDGTSRMQLIKNFLRGLSWKK